MTRVAFDIQFEWDPRKARSNQAKHDVGFEAAATVFGDRHALTIYDTPHSGEQDRWLTIGRDRNGSYLSSSILGAKAPLPALRFG
jgi:uncharacterized DUF497 family protein